MFLNFVKPQMQQTYDDVMMMHEIKLSNKENKRGLLLGCYTGRARGRPKTGRFGWCPGLIPPARPAQAGSAAGCFGGPPGLLRWQAGPPARCCSLFAVSRPAWPGCWPAPGWAVGLRHFLPQRPLFVAPYKRGFFPIFLAELFFLSLLHCCTF